MKKIVLLFSILSVFSLNLFAIKSYDGPTDENGNGYAQSSAAKPEIEVEFELGTIWGFDIQEGQSGFKEIIDLDMTFVINPFTLYKSDISGIDYDEPYGVVEVSGGHVELDISDQVGDKSSDIQDSTSKNNLSINYELIYGKIVFDPLYLLVASSNKGNHYTRNSGWSFSRGTSAIRADIAHIGYNVPTAEMMWGISGLANPVSEANATSLLGLGSIFGSTEVLLQVGSAKDWETNEDNEYEIGFMLESNPVGDLTVKAQVNSGMNYDIIPINFAVGSGYRFELSDTMSVVPFVGFDGDFIGTEDDPMDAFNSETSVGATLTWPGGSGWGYEPLNDTSCNRYSGVSGGVDIFNQDGFDPQYSIIVSAFEETNGGLVPMLGSSVVVEIADITDYLDTDRDFIKMSYGVYLDYNIMDMYRPFVRGIKSERKEDSEINFQSGVEFTAIPNTIITVGYDTADISDVGNNKGLFYTEFKVVL